jgi:hypothetical protein
VLDALGQDKDRSGRPADNGVARIVAVLDLPSGSRVLRVHGEQVSSADEALRRLQEAFANEGGGGAAIDLQTASGPGRVYLMPAPH